MAEASRPKGPESPDQRSTRQNHPNPKGVMKGKDGSSDRSVAPEHSDETPGYHELAGAFMKSANKLQGGASAKPESMKEKKSTVLKTRLEKLESAEKSLMANLEVHFTDNGSKEGINFANYFLDKCRIEINSIEKELTEARKKESNQVNDSPTRLPSLSSPRNQAAQKEALEERKMEITLKKEKKLGKGINKITPAITLRLETEKKLKNPNLSEEKIAKLEAKILEIDQYIDKVDKKLRKSLYLHDEELKKVEENLRKYL